MSRRQSEPGQQKRIGFLSGQFVIPDDFDRMGEDAFRICSDADVNLLLDTHILLSSSGRARG